MARLFPYRASSNRTIPKSARDKGRAFQGMTMRSLNAVILGLTATLCLGCATEQNTQSTSRSRVQWNDQAMVVRTHEASEESARVGAGDALGRAIFADKSMVVRSPRSQPSQLVGADGAVMIPE